jgi:hypothetical protein
MSDESKPPVEPTPEPASTEDKMAQLDKLEAGVMDQIKQTFDTKSTLKRHAALGKAFVKRAQYEAIVTGDGWNRTAYSQLAQRLELRARVEMGIPSVKLDVAAKIHGFLEAVRVTHKSVDDVSYYRISNKFAQMFQWDCKKLEGQIKPEWLTFVRSHIDGNAEIDGAKPMSIKELDSKIAEQEALIKSESDAKSGPKDPGKALASKARAAQTAALKKRDESRAKLTDAIADVVENGDFAADDLSKHLAAVTTEYGISLPREVVHHFDAKSIDVKGATEIMQALYAAGKMAEIHAMVNMGQQMIKAMLEVARPAA